MSALFGGHWLSIRDGDPRARSLFIRHYSARPGARVAGLRGNYAQFIGPGEYLALMTERCDALFTWRRERRQDGQSGINCSIFRNESAVLSSDLIREADDLAWERWPGERHFTFVNPRKVRSTNPGCCFIKAGWRRLPGLTKKRKLICLERLPVAGQLDVCECGDYRHQHTGPEHRGACRICAYHPPAPDAEPCERFRLLRLAEAAS